MSLIKNTIVIILVLTGMFAFNSASAHPYHVSVFQIDYNPETSSFEISLKVFLDDMDKALKAWGATDMDFESNTSDPFLKNYFGKSTRIKLDSEWKEATFLGKETDFEAVWLYLEVKIDALPENLTFETTLLTEIYEDQMNIVHIKLAEDKKYSARLNKDQNRKEFQF